MRVGKSSGAKLYTTPPIEGNSVLLWKEVEPKCLQTFHMLKEYQLLQLFVNWWWLDWIWKFTQIRCKLKTFHAFRQLNWMPFFLCLCSRVFIKSNVYCRTVASLFRWLQCKPRNQLNKNVSVSFSEWNPLKRRRRVALPSLEGLLWHFRLIRPLLALCKFNIILYFTSSFSIFVF